MKLTDLVASLDARAERRAKAEEKARVREAARMREREEREREERERVEAERAERRAEKRRSRSGGTGTLDELLAEATPVPEPKPEPKRKPKRERTWMPTEGMCALMATLYAGGDYHGGPGTGRGHGSAKRVSQLVLYGLIEPTGERTPHGAAIHALTDLGRAFVENNYQWPGEPPLVKTRTYKPREPKAPERRVGEVAPFGTLSIEQQHWLARMRTHYIAVDTYYAVGLSIAAHALNERGVEHYYRIGPRGIVKEVESLAEAIEETRPKSREARRRTENRLYNISDQEVPLCHFHEGITFHRWDLPYPPGGVPIEDASSDWRIAASRDPAERIGFIDARSKLDEMMETLPPRERRVLAMRFGLDGHHPRTLDEVGRTFNVTRERVRQVENQALKGLRAAFGAVEPPGPVVFSAEEVATVEEIIANGGTLKNVAEAMGVSYGLTCRAARHAGITPERRRELRGRVAP